MPNYAPKVIIYSPRGIIYHVNSTGITIIIITYDHHLKASLTIVIYDHNMIIGNATVNYGLSDG
jgi:hypothetical protein